MKRETVEKKIIKKLKEIDALVKAYYPENDYLSLTIMHNDDESYYSVYNRSYEDKSIPAIYKSIFEYGKEIKA